MRGITLLRHADRPARPWKNGGGVMWDIAVSPAGADMDAFDWRVSLARIEESRAFSAFPGIDRHFAVMEGSGVRLAVAGQPEALIRPGDQCLAFSGDIDVAATLEKDPVLALNVMTRRGRYAAVMNHAQFGTPATLAAPPAPARQRLTCLLVLAEGKARYGRFGNTVLEAGDALLWDSATELEIKPSGPIRFWWITIGPDTLRVTPRLG